jgi:hypothetical protein
MCRLEANLPYGSHQRRLPKWEMQQTQVVNYTVHQPQIRQLPANLRRTVNNAKLVSDTVLKILQNEVSRLPKQHNKRIELTIILHP